jgi:Mrp family chromosome partitioning ATPase
MNSLLKVMDFGNEAGDDADPEELATYFVEQPTFAKFLATSYKILVATAKKGVGKSALLQWAAYNIAQKDPAALVIKC